MVRETQVDATLSGGPLILRQLRRFTSGIPWLFSYSVTTKIGSTITDQEGDPREPRTLSKMHPACRQKNPCDHTAAVNLNTQAHTKPAKQKSHTRVFSFCPSSHKSVSRRRWGGESSHHRTECDVRSITSYSLLLYFLYVSPFCKQTSFQISRGGGLANQPRDGPGLEPACFVFCSQSEFDA